MPPVKKTAKRTVKRTTAKKTSARSNGRVAAKRTVKRTTAKKAPAKRLSASHRAALATGRNEARHVRAYLDALAANAPRRGRQRTVETIRKQLADVQSQLRSASGFGKLELVARRMELQGELAAKSARADVSGLRKNFVKHAASYARRKGITRQAFREAGVPASDIRDAGIK